MIRSRRGEFVEERTTHIVEPVCIIESERERQRRDLQRRTEIGAFVREETQRGVGMPPVEVTAPVEKQPAFPEPAAPDEDEDSRLLITDKRIKLLYERSASDEGVAIDENEFRGGGTS